MQFLLGMIFIKKNLQDSPNRGILEKGGVSGLVVFVSCFFLSKMIYNFEDYAEIFFEAWGDISVLQ